MRYQSVVASICIASLVGLTTWLLAFGQLPNLGQRQDDRQPAAEPSNNTGPDAETSRGDLRVAVPLEQDQPPTSDALPASTDPFEVAADDATRRAARTQLESIIASQLDGPGGLREELANLQPPADMAAFATELRLRVDVLKREVMLRKIAIGDFSLREADQNLPSWTRRPLYIRFGRIVNTADDQPLDALVIVNPGMDNALDGLVREATAAAVSAVREEVERLNSLPLDERQRRVHRIQELRQMLRANRSNDEFALMAKELRQLGLGEWIIVDESRFEFGVDPRLTNATW